MYECTVYSSPSGTREASGWFVLADPPRHAGEPYAPIAGGLPLFEPSPSTWDGSVLHISSALALAPDGEIDYPLRGGHGKKQLYRSGLSIGPEVPY